MTPAQRSTRIVAALFLLGLGALLVTRAPWGPELEPEPDVGPATTRSAEEPPGEDPALASAPDAARVAVGASEEAASTNEPEAASTTPLFHGRAVDDRDERPVAGARVRVTSASRAGRTDDDGRFVLPLPGGATRPAVLEARGYARLLFAAGSGHGEPGASTVLRLVRGATLRARVVAASGGGLPGVEVVLRAGAAEQVRVEGQIVNPFLLDDETWTAETDANGEALLPDLTPGADLHVELRREGSTFPTEGRPVVLSPGEEAEREFVVGEGVTILGHVRDDAGSPVAGTEVWRLSGVADMVAVFRPDQRASALQRTTTADDGTFEMEGVPAGTWWVGVAPSDAFAGDAATVGVTAAPLVSEVELVVYRGLTLGGTVVGPDGPVPFAQVQARQRSGRLVDVSGFARQGAFELGPLVPGTYEVGAGAEGLTGPGVTAEAGDQDVVITLQAGCVLRGRVVDAATGQPVVASTRAQRTSAEHAFASIGRPPEVGSDFAFRNLWPIEYGLVARTSDGRVGVLRAVAEPADGTTVHELAVMPGATLELRLAAGAPRAFVTLWLDDVLLFGNGLQRGDHLDVPVPAGGLLLVWHPLSGDPLERTVGGAAGTRIEVVLGDD